MKQVKFAQAGISVMALIFIMALTGCGENPKSLAKQTYDIGQQSLGALFNPSKAAELKQKADAIQIKVAKLSEKDKAVYTAELARLGGETLGDLLNAASGDALKQANDAAEDALKRVKDAADTAKKAADALKSYGKKGQNINRN